MEEVSCMVCAFPMGQNDTAQGQTTASSESAPDESSPRTNKGKSTGTKAINNSDAGHTINRLRCCGACTHCNDICSICFLRIRSLQRNFNCPVCKTALPQVLSNSNLIDPVSKKSLQFLSDFEIWGDSAGPYYTFDEKAQIFFPKDYYRKNVEGLFQFKCKVCDTVKRDLKSLKTHYQADHSLYLCNHCIDHKQIFPAEQKVYTQQQYEQHLRQGDGDGSEGHPNCEFCRRRYYDKTALFTHLSKEHYTCHLCEKDGIKFKYYANYDSLEAHFRRSHHLCDDELCLSKKFVVFSTSIELSAHQRQYHTSYANQSRNIPIHFKVKRSTSSGSMGKTINSTDPDDELTEDEMRMIYSNNNNNNERKYDAGLAGRAMNGEWQIELPSVREPVEMRGSMRAALGASSSSGSGSSSGVTEGQDDYPGLPGSYGRLHPIWTGAAGDRQHRKKAMEDFPELGGKPKVSNASAIPSGPVKSASAQAPAISSWSMPTKKDKRLARPRPQQQPAAICESPVAVSSSSSSHSISGNDPDGSSGGGSTVLKGTELEAPKKKAAKPNNNTNNISNINNIFKSLGLISSSSGSNNSKKKSGGLTVVKTNAVIQKVASGGNLAASLISSSSSSFVPSDSVPTGPINADIFSNLIFPLSNRGSSSAHAGDVLLLPPPPHPSPPPGFVIDDLPPPPRVPSQPVVAPQAPAGLSIADSWVTVGGASRSSVAKGRASSSAQLSEALYPSLPPSTIVPGLLAMTSAVAGPRPAHSDGAKKPEGGQNSKHSKKMKSDLQSLAFKTK